MESHRCRGTKPNVNASPKISITEIKPLIYFRLSQDPSGEEVAATAPCAAETSGWAIAPFPLHFHCLLRGDLSGLLHVFLPVITVVSNIFSIIKCQLGHCWDGFSSEERQVVDVDVCMVIGGCDYSAIGLTGVIDETRRSTHKHPVADIAFTLLPHVETEEVVVGIRIAFLAAAVSFFTRDDFPSVRIDELASLQIDLTPQTFVVLATRHPQYWIYSPQPRFLVLNISKGTFRPCWTTRFLQFELQLQRALHSKTCHP